LAKNVRKRKGEFFDSHCSYQRRAIRYMTTLMLCNSEKNR